jgi:hypothetical protein
MELEELEARILLSTFTLQDPGAATDANVEEQQLTQEEAELLSAAGGSDASTTLKGADAIDGPSDSEAVAEVRHEIVFVDEGVEDYDILLSGLLSGADSGREVEVVVLSNARDGIDQISEALADRDDLDAVHFVVHGADGQVALGNSLLDSSTLAARSDEIAGWADSLDAEADLLFYGCNLAASEEGKALVSTLADLTGTDISASDDLTGAATLGGDWDLEYRVGTVETSGAVSAEAQQSYGGLLATPVLDNNALTITEGGTVILSGAELSATDAETADGLLAFTITGVTGGQFEAVATPGSGITTFTQQQITDGEIQFAHDGGEAAPAYSVTVSDGVLVDGPLAATISFTSVNDAPVLDNTKNPTLTSINEDAGTPSGPVGTLVSQLVDFATPAGQVDNVMDPDAGSLLGIALTAADTTSGTWHFSTDNGTTWNALGAVSEANARLLAADADTRLYFEPNSNYSGTLTNAITFRAWDRSDGSSSGAIASAGYISETVLDQFSAVSYSNNNGTQAWSSDWIEIGDTGGASFGAFKVKDNVLKVSGDNPGGYIYREANLAGASSATLSFAFDNNIEVVDQVSVVQVSGDGGANYFTLATFDAATDTGSGIKSFDISSYAASNTRVRFLVTASGEDSIKFDDVQIQYSNANDGGTSAFSTAWDTASLIVNPVADTPSVTGAATNEDTQSTSGLVISRNAADSAEVTHFKVTGITNGTLYKNDGTTQISDGSFITFAEGNAGLKFTPAAGFSGTGSFTVQASTSNVDGGLGGGTANAAITVNDSPTAVADADTVLEAATVSIDLAANDTDPDDGLDLTSIQIVSGPTNGSLVVNLDGTVDYTHNGSETTTDSFTYTIRDASGALSNTATVSLAITPQDDNPVLGNNALTITEGGTVLLSGAELSATDAETAAGLLQFTITGVSGGQFEEVAFPGAAVTSFTQQQITDGEIQFVHDGGETAPAYSVTVSDGALVDGPLAATITFTNVNDAPSLDLDADDSVTAGTGFDSSFVMFGGPVSIVDVDASLSDADDSFLVGMTVTITNMMDSGSETLAADTAGTAITATFDAGSGVLTLAGTDTLASYEQVLRSVTYDNAMVPPDLTTRIIAIVADDGLDLSNVADARVAIDAPNLDPTAEADAAALTEGTSVVIDLAANDTDPEAALDLTSIQIVSGPANGTVAEP